MAPIIPSSRDDPKNHHSFLKLQAHEGMPQKQRSSMPCQSCPPVFQAQRHAHRIGDSVRLNFLNVLCALATVGTSDSLCCKQDSPSCLIQATRHFASRERHSDSRLVIRDSDGIRMITHCCYHYGVYLHIYHYYQHAVYVCVCVCVCVGVWVCVRT